jgi:hypothetical protein
MRALVCCSIKVFIRTGYPFWGWEQVLRKVSTVRLYIGDVRDSQQSPLQLGLVRPKAKQLVIGFDKTTAHGDGSPGTDKESHPVFGADSFNKVVAWDFNGNIGREEDRECN